MTRARKEEIWDNFSNVSSPLPCFTETFVDDGYMDMYPVMKAFVEVGYQGTMILDHTPRFAGGPSKDKVEKRYAAIVYDA